MDKPTREEILNEPGGRRLDAWTAAFAANLPDVEEVAGGLDYSCTTNSFRDKSGAVHSSRAPVPCYGANIGVAWSLLAGIEAKGLTTTIGTSSCDLTRDGTDVLHISAPAPEAIARAALLVGLGLVESRQVEPGFSASLQ